MSVKKTKKAVKKVVKKVVNVVKKVAKKSAKKVSKKATKKTVKKIAKTPKSSTSNKTRGVRSYGLLDLESWQITDGGQDKEKCIESDCFVNVCKPEPLEFIRVKDKWRIKLALVEYRPLNQFWIVLPEVAKNAGKNSEIAEYWVYLVITEYGRLLLWPVREGDGSWLETRRMAVKDAINRWVRVKADVPKRRFYTVDADDEAPYLNLEEPEWPTDLTQEEIISIGFGKRVIRDLNHPLLRKLQGKKRSKIKPNSEDDN